jgi:hypothetical protein
VNRCKGVEGYRQIAGCKEAYEELVVRSSSSWSEPDAWVSMIDSRVVLLSCEDTA